MQRGNHRAATDTAAHTIAGNRRRRAGFGRLAATAPEREVARCWRSLRGLRRGWSQRRGRFAPDGRRTGGAEVDVVMRAACVLDVACVGYLYADFASVSTPPPDVLAERVTRVRDLL